MKVSLIISTYNWPAALEASLVTACRQSYADYEIIVADDGSGQETRDVIARVSASMRKPILHAWHEDKGFRLAMIRNRAVAQASGEYVVFVDGDCLLPRDFIKNHVWLAQKKCFVAGSRVQFVPAITAQLLQKPSQIPDFTKLKLVQVWLQRQIRRIHPILKWPFQSLRHRRPTKWQGAVGCNIAVWREDYDAVNGFDNEFIGWGREDSEFIMRLIHSGVMRKDGKLCSYVLHLYHKKGSGIPVAENEARFQRTISGQLRIAQSGLTEVTKENL